MAFYIPTEVTSMLYPYFPSPLMLTEVVANCWQRDVFDYLNWQSGISKEIDSKKLQ